MLPVKASYCSINVVCIYHIVTTRQQNIRWRRCATILPILLSKYNWLLILIAYEKRRAEISFQHGMDYQQINIIRPWFVTTTNIFCIGSWTIAAWFAFRDYKTRTRLSVFQSWSRPHPRKPWFQRFGSLQFCCSRLTTDLKVASNFFLVKFWSLATVNSF